jgi:hypothetical protein
LGAALVAAVVSLEVVEVVEVVEIDAYPRFLAVLRAARGSWRCDQGDSDQQPLA